ncbi:mediator of RNA polymerase II transcription subunit [Striga asiatica]|uniref:Mediator of RNA polymerase II transcription subunit n=1 Tax=Striga asiatica TaxID=4170 RepID=A0A5A7P8Z8_STRAF|nr:mediator of RNA polymerase II transcription subunit [Striga asiatica]
MGGTLWDEGAVICNWSAAMDFTGTQEEALIMTTRWALMEGRKRRLEKICCCLGNANLVKKLMDRSSFPWGYNVVADDVYLLVNSFSSCSFLFNFVACVLV